MKKTVYPNRPIDLTVASELHQGEALHRGLCSEGTTVRLGDFKHAKYLVISAQTNFPKAGQFRLTVCNEFSFEVLHLTPETASEYHRVSDCPSKQREESHPPGKKIKRSQQITL